MTNRLKLAAVALALGLSAGGAVAAQGQQPGAAASRTITLDVAFERSSIHTTDLGRRGPSIGDMTSLSGKLFSNGAAAGREELVTNHLDPRYGAVIMHAGLLLADGTLQMQTVGTDKRAPGAAAPVADTALAIVGGTGAYAGARGTVLAHDHGPGIRQRLTITLLG
ncbi:MAG: hypothetical protein QOJ89_3762 [bacterium]|jgi:hypothetical protein